MSGEADTLREALFVLESHDMGDVSHDAMAALDALVAALEEAERQRDEARAELRDADAALAVADATNAMLTAGVKECVAQRDVVRDALRIIAALAKEKQYDDFGGGEAAAAYERAASIARAALAVSVDEPPSPDLGGTAEAVPGSGGAT